ncbi:HPP family protein [Deinococcus lacus]|uniref:HPP family protein n=1 Tax=Deinococcus lacus TaxID=392561 RepID=A0ABW1YDR7_9DEIO
MQAYELMTCPAAVLAPSSSLMGALRWMRQAGVSELPVLDGGRFAGLVRERDLLEALWPLPLPGLRASLWPSQAGQAVRSLMRRVPAATPDMPLPAALRLLLDARLSSLPVVGGGGDLLGMLSSAAVLERLAAGPPPPPQEDL